MALPPLSELLEHAHAVRLPLVTRFRGLDAREALLLRGPLGWTEFSPFAEYDDAESANWLAAAIEFGWTDAAERGAVRDEVWVNATVPALPVEQVPELLRRFDGCRTAKVKVAAGDETLTDDLARVAEVRRVLGPEGRVRLDANAGWSIDAAEHAIRALAQFDLEYVEQPCATVEELAELRERTADLDVPIAADESVRRASDPLLVARAEAADTLIIKVQPLGGVQRARELVAEAGLPVTVSSALETSVGLAMGAFLAASLPERDAGLGTAELLGGDVTHQPLAVRGGRITVRRVHPDAELLERWAAPAEARAWWLARLQRCYEHLGR